MTPTPRYGRDEEAKLRSAWKGLDPGVRRAIWRSVSYGERVADPAHASLGVWLARRLCRTVLVQGAFGGLAGILLASILYRAHEPLGLVLLAVFLGAAQPFVALRRYRRARAAERKNLAP
jgi:hypothetical protein